MESFSVSTQSRDQFLDITGQVGDIVKRNGVKSGLCCVYTPHTTAAITINENADPDVRRDIIKGMNHLKLEAVLFDHAEGNSPAHIKSSLFGCSEMIIIENGTLQLGTWQGIYFCEFDGPRNRKVYVQIVS
jgi:secondary thiamine-phosphate synthase enzyme